MKNILQIVTCMVVIFIPLFAESQTVTERADSAFRQGNYVEAHEGYAGALKIVSQKSEREILWQKYEIAKKAGNLLTDANNLWNRGKYDDAVKKYNELLEINPNDSFAIKRVAECGKKQQLSKAMYWYDRLEYSKALTCFQNAGSKEEWTTSQLNAYRVCLEEYYYSIWEKEKNLYTVAGRNAALEIVQNHPNSRYAVEMKNYLFKYYMKNDDFAKASLYATTTAQRSQLQTSREEYLVKKTMAKKSESVRRDNRISRPTYFDPTWSFATELSVTSNDPCEIAIPVDVRLFEPECRLNLFLGGRIGLRGTLLGDTVTFSLSSSSNRIIGLFRYYQLSPYIKARINFTDDITDGGGFFLSGIGRLNYNFKYTYTENSSEITSYGYVNSTNKYKYHPDVLTPLTFTIVGELGYGSELFEIYCYYSYDITRPIGEAKVREMGQNITDPHHTMISRSTFNEFFEKTGFFGVGLRVY